MRDDYEEERSRRDACEEGRRFRTLIQSGDAYKAFNYLAEIRGIVSTLDRREFNLYKLDVFMVEQLYRLDQSDLNLFIHIMQSPPIKLLSKKR